MATPPSGTFSAVSSAISAGDNLTCGIQVGGTLACWGNNAAGQSSLPTGSFTAVSAGGFHACGLGTGGTVTCWGQNSEGQANPRITTPVPPGGTLGVPYLHAMGTTYESPAATYTVTAGSLPPGLLLSGNGVLSGTPTATGTFGATRGAGRQARFPAPSGLAPRPFSTSCDARIAVTLVPMVVSTNPGAAPP
jgi:hypothetical protein